MKLILSILFLPAIVFAHPISQGSLDIELLNGKLHVRARVPLEEVLVANAFGAGNAGSIGDAWKEHGRYFLRHFQIRADGRELAGALTGVTEAGANHIVYDLDYPLSYNPDRLELRQNLLNEFLYAPGNPWEATFVVQMREGGRLRHEGLLLTSKQALTVANAATGQERRRIFGEYLRHGVTHILEGYDHLLFITALVLATVTLWDLIKVVTAFTLAHTITLSLSVLDIIRLSSAVVEPMIAGSIVFVALSNIIWPQRSRGWVRLATAFFFGLFHGLGFAGGLLDAMEGMAGIAIGAAIVAFSIGVELGHQLVVLPLFCGLKLTRLIRSDATSRDRLSLSTMRIGSVFICAAGTVYLVAALK
ncbi:MAG: HupE/UreJ family protein [Methylococcaceae bacterium]|nr:HupE/UreJ family protein [Methylococcaceae bacterium]MCI0733207.1 HupE/UreJ family protein [Methylococcaceae bacterium]